MPIKQFSGILCSNLEFCYSSNVINIKYLYENCTFAAPARQQSNELTNNEITQNS